MQNLNELSQTNETKINAVGIMLGTAVVVMLMVVGWQSDEAWIPQTMLVAGGYIARGVRQLIKEI